MLFTLPLFLALQTAPASQSTPPSGDTAAYWQQEVRYRITARLARTLEAPGPADRIPRDTTSPPG